MVTHSCACDLRYRDAGSLHSGVGETSAWCDVGLMAAEPWERWYCINVMGASVHERHRGDHLHISHWPCRGPIVFALPSRVIAAREAEATKRRGGVR
jgi:hypothetical protein